MARLLGDENFPEPVQLELRHLGHDVASLADIGLSQRSSSDEEILMAASNSKRILLTLDRGLSRLWSRHEASPGIIVCSFDADFAGMARRIHALLSNTDRVDGKVVQLGRQHRRYRQRGAAPADGA
jgi:predicted nuclease of predicted toxin-antitoxin system